MSYRRIKGKRETVETPVKSISIFFMSAVYPANTGYLKRMDLLVRWTQKRFSTVNFIIPNRGSLSDCIIEEHLKYCDNLFLINVDNPRLKILMKVRKFLYILATGRYPKFDSSLFLSDTLAINLEKVTHTFRTDYFLNTRNNFGGLISFVPDGTLSIFDTQDIFTDMHRKYGMKGKRPWLKRLLIGYKESGDFVQSEVEILNKYDKIIAITDCDYRKYSTILVSPNKLLKIESLGIEPRNSPASIMKHKEFDCLIVASNFSATQEGVYWFFTEVAPCFSKEISLCVVGSICEYIESQKLGSSNVKLSLQGFVNEVEEYYQKSRLTTLLMLTGTGTSVKGIEALAFGSAIVSTKVGVRFGGLETGKHCIITENPREFAVAIETLIDDVNKRERLGIEALEFAKKRFSLKATFDMLDKCII